MQIASEALYCLAEQERFDWLSSQLLKLSSDDRSKVYEDVDQRQQKAEYKHLLAIGNRWRALQIFIAFTNGYESQRTTGYARQH